MAVRYWDGGAGDNNIATAANWSSDTAPTTGDTAIIASGSQSISGTLGDSLAGFSVTPGFSGTIDVQVAAVTAFTYGGTGAFARFTSSGTVTAADFGHTAGRVEISGGTWTTLTNGAGVIHVKAAAVVTNARNTLGTYTDEYNATGYTTFKNGGSADIQRAHATTNVYAGHMVSRDAGITELGATTSITVHNKATYTKLSSANEPIIEVLPGGYYTTKGNSGGQDGAITLGGTSFTVWLGGDYDISALPGVTITASVTHLGTGTLIGRV